MVEWIAGGLQEEAGQERQAGSSNRELTGYMDKRSNDAGKTSIVSSNGGVRVGDSCRVMHRLKE